VSDGDGGYQKSLGGAAAGAMRQLSVLFFWKVAGVVIRVVKQL
jgi:hypothetical protein